MQVMQIFLILISVEVIGVYGGDKRAACVIQCEPKTGGYGDLGLAECPPEHECRNTGCGTMCFHKSQIVPSHDKRGSCIMVCGKTLNKTCSLDGYDCIHNGCGRECKLREDYLQPPHCAPFSCDLHCITGYYRDDKGCDHCQCAYTIV